MKTAQRLVVSTFLFAAICTASYAVPTDESRTNTISSIGTSTGTVYITMQTALLDTNCLYGVINLPSSDLASTKTMYAAALAAYTQALPINRLVYDRNTTTNSCTLQILNF